MFGICQKKKCVGIRNLKEARYVLREIKMLYLYKKIEKKITDNSIKYFFDFKERIFLNNK